MRSNWRSNERRKAFKLTGDPKLCQNVQPNDRHINLQVTVKLTLRPSNDPRMFVKLTVKQWSNDHSNCTLIAIEWTSNWTSTDTSNWLSNDSRPQNNPRMTLEWTSNESRIDILMTLKFAFKLQSTLVLRVPGARIANGKSFFHRQMTLECSPNWPSIDG